ncbi:VanZ family protein [Paenibacillus solisilvae]|uniref:VanZ family protein n=1 Tax=Paenibacillus solisilvae TaxID=2486751 RepID=A0ABW0WAS7_9BACL
MRKLAAIITISYTLLLFYWMFMGFGRSNRIAMGYSYNVIPFHTLKMYMNHADHFDMRTWFINVVGNVAVFVPFGIAIPYLIGIRVIRFTLSFIAALFIIEFLQLILRRGSFDIDDVLLNTIGAMIGYFVYWILMRIKAE